MPGARLVATLALCLGVVHGSLVACGPAPTSRGPVVLQRVSTAVPWPRGLRFHEGRLIVLARGAHRDAGGPRPDLDDQAGSLFVVDPDVYEAVESGAPAGAAVVANGTVLADPADPPFHLWDRELPTTRDTRTDRPYCTLVYDEASRSFFICGFSGLDRPGPAKFRKNATDSVLRYDLRSESWHRVEAHREDVIPAEQLGRVLPNELYPHHDPERNAPPHGLVNGPCGAVVVGRYLYVGAKDNTGLARYDLAALRRDPAAGPPAGRLEFHRSAPDDDVFLPVDGHGEMYVEGTCALAAHDGFLYVAFRTTSQILRFPIDAEGALVRPLLGQLIARFAPYDPARDSGSANIYDMAFDGSGRLYVSPAYTGAVYRFTPDPEEVFDATEGYDVEPYVDLRALTDNPSARTGNIALDAQGHLYVCSNNRDDPGSELHGVIYRVPAR